MKPESPWNDERIEQLKDLWATGASAAEIAAGLGAGVSRCAVLGKIFRLGLSEPHPASRRRAKEPRPVGRRRETGSVLRGKRVKPEPLPCSSTPCSSTAAVVDTADPLHLAFTDLRASHCRWPYGDGPFTFCGHLCADDSSYCERHARIARGGAAPKRKGGFRVSIFRKRPARKAA